MRCNACGTTFADDEKRCPSCQRRVQSITLPDAAPSAVAYDHKLQQAPAADPGNETRPGTMSGPPRQQPLFAQKVIPFETLVTTRRQYGRRREPVRAEPETPRTHSRAAQTSFELRAPAVSAPAAPLPTADLAPVAPLDIRMKAAAMDLLFCAVGIAVFAATFYVAGGRFAFSGSAMRWWGATAAALMLSYQLFFAMTGHNSAGMRCYGLRLVTFDGAEPETRLRVIRLFWTLLFFAAFGVGLLWAYFDDESLTWQDQITKTYPAPRESRGTLRRR